MVLKEKETQDKRWMGDGNSIGQYNYVEKLKNAKYKPGNRMACEAYQATTKTTKKTIQTGLIIISVGMIQTKAK